jgi:hypothetical protein
MGEKPKYPYPNIIPKSSVSHAVAMTSIHLFILQIFTEVNSELSCIGTEARTQRCSRGPCLPAITICRVFMETETQTQRPMVQMRCFIYIISLNLHPNPGSPIFQMKKLSQSG